MGAHVSLLHLFLAKIYLSVKVLTRILIGLNLWLGTYISPTLRVVFYIFETQFSHIFHNGLQIAMALTSSHVYLTELQKHYMCPTLDLEVIFQNTLQMFYL